MMMAMCAGILRGIESQRQFPIRIAPEPAHPASSCVSTHRTPWRKVVAKTKCNGDNSGYRGAGYSKLGPVAISEKAACVAGLRIGRRDPAFHRRFPDPAGAGAGRPAALRTAAALAAHRDSAGPVSGLDPGGAGLFARPAVRHSHGAENGGLPDAADRLFVGPHSRRSEDGWCWPGSASAPSPRDAACSSSRPTWPERAPPTQDFYHFYIADRIRGFMSHWMTFSGQEFYILLLAAAFLLFAPDIRKWRWLGLPCAAVVGIALVLSDTRSIWIAAVVAGFYLLWFWRKWAALAMPVLLALGLLVAPARDPGSARARSLQPARRDRFQPASHHCLAHGLADDQGASACGRRAGGDP